MAASIGRRSDNILELIGGTPLVRLRRLPEQLAGPNAAEVWVKCEQFNPGGSVKDRIALAMIEAAEREGAHQAGRERHRRADVGQHGHRPGAGVRGQGLPPGADDAGVDVARAALAAQGLRRRAHPDAGRAHDGGRGRARRGAVPQEQEPLHAAAVQQPGEPRGAPAHDRARAHRAARRARLRRVRRRRRHRRNDHRRRRDLPRQVSGRARSSRSSRRRARCCRAVRSGRTRSRASAPASCRRS